MRGHMIMSDQLVYDVFLSHNSNQKPWVHVLAQRLRNANFSVSFDEDSIHFGEDISAALESGIRRSRRILLVLSKEALASRWVAFELSMSLCRDPAAATRVIIPVLLENCELPLSIARLKYVDARDPSNFEAQFAALMDSIRSEAKDALRDSPVAPTAVREGMSKAPEVIRFHAGGTLPPEADSYIQRAEDLELEAELQQPKGLAVIWGARQMGKSSMVIRALHRMRARGSAIAYVDLSACA